MHSEGSRVVLSLRCDSGGEQRGSPVGIPVALPLDTAQAYRDRDGD